MAFISSERPSLSTGACLSEVVPEFGLAHGGPSAQGGAVGQDEQSVLRGIVSTLGLERLGAGIAPEFNPAAVAFQPTGLSMRKRPTRVVPRGCRSPEPSATTSRGVNDKRRRES